MITFFIDIDGVLYDGNEAIPGGAEAIRYLQGQDIKFLLVTNTSRMSAQQIGSRLNQLDYPVSHHDIFAVPQIAVDYVTRRYGSASCFLITDAKVEQMFADAGHLVTRDEKPVDVVILSTIEWPHFGEIDIAARLIRDGAEPIAMHRDKFYPDGGVARLGLGAVVAALESVIERPVTVIGKPNPEFFHVSLEHAGFKADHTIMIGDTPEVDIAGATSAGLRSIQVATGNGSQPAARAEATWNITSIADLPEWCESHRDLVGG
jgi:HAD superfamily hydrolase (TIGR01458 family)